LELSGVYSPSRASSLAAARLGALPCLPPWRGLNLFSFQVARSSRGAAVLRHLSRTARFRDRALFLEALPALSVSLSLYGSGRSCLSLPYNPLSPRMVAESFGGRRWPGSPSSDLLRLYPFSRGWSLFGRALPPSLLITRSSRERLQTPLEIVADRVGAWLRDSFRVEVSPGRLSGLPHCRRGSWRLGFFGGVLQGSW